MNYNNEIAKVNAIALINTSDVNADNNLNKAYPVTVLKTQHEHQLACKTYKNDGQDGIALYKSYSAGKEFFCESKAVADIYGLGDLIKTISTDHRKLIIRGKLVDGKDPNGLVYRRSDVPKWGDTVCFEPYPEGLPWIDIDIDKLETPDNIDFLANPVDGIKYAISQLPNYFHDVTCFYQLSNSAGGNNGKIIKCHLWYFLDQCVHDSKLRKWGQSLKHIIDPSPLGTVQPNYVANPFLIGVPDPYPDNRLGFITGTKDRVPFPEFKEEPVAPKYPSGSSSSLGSGSLNAPSFEMWLEKIGDHVPEGGFHFEIFHAFEAFIWGDDDLARKDEAISIVQHAVLNADSSKHPDKGYIALHASYAHLSAEYDSAYKKVQATKEAYKQTKDKHHAKLTGIEPYYGSKEFYSASDALVELKDIIKSYVLEPRNIAVKFPAGVGKTTSVIAWIISEFFWDEQQHKKVAIFVPTLNLADEIAKKITHLDPKKFKTHPAYTKGLSTDIKVVVIRGRDWKSGEYLKDTNNFHCNYASEADAVAKKGYSVYPTLCQRGSKKKGNYERCTDYSNCQYNKQFQKEWQIRIYPSAYLSIPHTFLDNELPDYAFIDESFYNVMLKGANDTDDYIDDQGNKKPRLIPFTKIKKAPWNPKLKDLLVNVPLDEPLLTYLRSNDADDELEQMLDEAIEISEESSKKNSPSLINLAFLEKSSAANTLPPKINLLPLLIVLRNELSTGREQCHGIEVHEDGLKVMYRQDISRFAKGGKTVPAFVMDASLDPEINAQFFPDAEFYEMPVKRNCHVVQCSSTANSKTTLTKDKVRIAQIQQIIDRVCKTGKTLVVGSQYLTGNKGKEIDSVFTVPDNGVLAHFNALRGHDGYKDFDNIIVIGRNEPHPEGLERVAKALFYDSETTLKTGIKKLEPKPRGYSTTTGYVEGRMVGTHPDARIQRVLEQIREEETLQVIDRLRLVHNLKPKMVYVLSNVTLDLPANNLIDWGEMVAGTTKLKECWKKMDGVLPLSSEWLASANPEIFPKTHNAKDYKKGLGNSKEGYLNALVIPDNDKINLYEWRIVGKSGKDSQCLSRYEKEQTRIKLAGVFEGVIEVL